MFVTHSVIILRYPLFAVHLSVASFPSSSDTLIHRLVLMYVVRQVLRSPKEAFAAAMQSWRERCEKCVCLQGAYVEK